MSYRSALNNPTTSSGNVGQVVSSGVVGAGAIPIGNSNIFVYIPVATITLTAGLWNINTSFTAILNNYSVAWFIEGLYVLDSAVLKTFLYNNTLQFYTDNGAVTDNFPYSNDCIVNLTETTVIQFALTQQVKNSGSISVANINFPLNGEFIVATKLA